MVGITAWYAFVHTATSELPAVIAGLTRVLIAGGRLAFVLHAGEEVRQGGELFGAPVDLEFVLHNASEVVDAVAAAGLVNIEWYLRSPLRDVETPTDASTSSRADPSDRHLSQRSAAARPGVSKIGTS